MVNIMLLERQPVNRPARSGTLFPKQINLLGVSNWFFPYFGADTGFVRYTISGNILYLGFLLGDLDSKIVVDSAIAMDLSSKETQVVANRSNSRLQVKKIMIDKGVIKHLIFYHDPFEIAILEVKDGSWIPYHNHPKGIAEIYVDISNHNFERCFSDEYHCLENFSGETKLVLAVKYPDRF